MSFKHGDMIDGTRYLKVFGTIDKNDISEARKAEYEKLLIVVYIVEDCRDLNWICELADTLEFLDIDTRFKNRVDIAGFEKLHRLNNLSLRVCPKQKIEIEKYPKLRKYFVECDKNIVNDFSKTKELEQLIICYLKDKNLSEVAGARNLKHLDIRMTQLESLDGLELLKKLEVLEIYDARKLNNIDSLNNHKKLITLRIEACNKITNMNFLSNMPKLEFLALNIRQVDSLAFVKKLTNLKTIAFGDTKVLDGNLEILEDHPNLENIHFRNKKHYSHKNVDFEN